MSKEIQKAKKPLSQDASPVVDRRNRQLKHLSVLTVILVIAAVIIVNLALESIIGKKVSWDLTQNQLMSTGEVTKGILADLKKNVRIVYLGTEDQLKQNRNLGFLPELLNTYVKEAHGMLQVDYIDPVADPAIVTQLDPENLHKLSAGALVVQGKENKRIKPIQPAEMIQSSFNQQTYQSTVTGYRAEAALTGAINYVNKDVLPTVYMLTGHSEAGLKDGYTTFANLLDGNGFAVKDINLSTSETVPEDASLVMVLAPSLDLQSAEADRLIAWVKQGGSILFAPGAFTPKALPQFNRVLAEFNLELSTDRVIEGDSRYHLPNYPSYIFATAPKNDITPDDVPVSLISDAAAVRALQNKVEWIETTPVLETSTSAYLEKGGQAEAKSEEGQQVLAMMSENKGFMDGKNVTHSSRALLFGSASIFSDQTFQVVGNSSYNIYLSYAGLNWLTQGAGDTDRLMIPSKNLVSYAISTRGSATPIYISAIVTALIFPLVLIVLAIVVYQRRKHL